MPTVERAGFRRTRLRILGTLGLLLVAGCAPHLSESPLDAGVPDWTCWPGFRFATGGAGCAPILPEADCAPGTMPVVGSESCVPVGPTACPVGFAADPSGWGCRDVAAETACPGATMAQLGSETCVPVDDCSGVFPPPEATLVVDPAGPVDATHFHSIAAALGSAPAGAVVAIAAGRYVEAMQPLRPMTLVGRCARDVIVDSPGDSTPGLHVKAVAVTAEHLTIHGMYMGVEVDHGGSATLRFAVLDANRTVGATVSGVGATLTLEHVVIRDTVNTGSAYGRGVQVQYGAHAALRACALEGNSSFGVFAMSSGSQVAIEDSLILRTRPDETGSSGLGVGAADGASATLTRTALVQNHEKGADARGGDLALSGCVVRDTATGRDGGAGYGLLGLGGAHLDVQGSTLAGNQGTAVGAADPGSTLRLVASVVRATRATAKASSGVTVKSGASLELRDSALVDNEDCGLLLVGAQATVARVLVRGTSPTTLGVEPRGVSVEEGACAAFTELAAVANTTVGMLLSDTGCPVRLLRSVVQDSRTNPTGSARGWGLSVQSSDVSLEQSVVRRLHNVGVFAFGTGAQLRVLNSSVSQVGPSDDGKPGIGVLGDELTTLQLLDSDVRGADIGLAFNGGAASISGGFVADNGVALHAQNGSTIVAGGPGGTPADATTVLVSPATRFEGNKARVGVGVVPLPSHL